MDIEDKVGYDVCIAVYGSVYDSVYNSVENSVWSSVRDLVRDNTWNFTNESIRNNIERAIYDYEY